MVKTSHVGSVAAGTTTTVPTNARSAAAPITEAGWDALGVRSVRATRGLRTISSQRETDGAIHRERCRADRTGQQFSLVLFRHDANGSTRACLRLARTVQARSRGTDQVGWYDDDTVCALLPDTAAAGARQFADNVNRTLPARAGRPRVTIYTYPGKWDQPAVAPSTPAATPPPPAEPDRPLSALLSRPMPWWKRAMDVVGAAGGLIAFAPVFALAALAIKVTDPGPVFFCQRRAGLGGRPFRIVKFRTMCVDAEAKKAALRAISEQDGPAFKLARDPRVTPVGHLLRKTSLDELPQLWNVLVGDMSLVGPRPLPVDEQGNAERWQQHRLDVTPGLTCVWQVTGRSTVTFAEWVRMDVNYIRRRTMWQDVKILVQTVPAVLLRRGAR